MSKKTPTFPKNKQINPMLQVKYKIILFIAYNYDETVS